MEVVLRRLRKAFIAFEQCIALCVGFIDLLCIFVDEMGVRELKMLIRRAPGLYSAKAIANSGLLESLCG